MLLLGFYSLLSDFTGFCEAFGIIWIILDLNVDFMNPLSFHLHA